MDWTSDNEDFEWESDDEPGPVSATAPIITTPSDAPMFTSNADCVPGPSRPPMLSHFMDMGFPEDMVLKAIEQNDECNSEAILETLLTYGVIGKQPSENDPSPSDCTLSSDMDNNADAADADLFYDDISEYEEFTEDLSEEDKKLMTLVEMGFPTNDAYEAICRCGSDATVLELADSIHAAQMANEYDGYGCRILGYSGDKTCVQTYSQDKKRKAIEIMKSRKRQTFSDGHPSPNSLPNPMVGFGLPDQKMLIDQRKLPETATGPPYFYYENVALAPKGVWETISRFLYDIKPEYVDSKYFCAAARKRAYIHNLPIHNRFPLRPIPPKTIHEVFPETRKWWPSWDPRKQFNCLQTVMASAKLTERIRQELSKHDDPPPIRVQQYVLNECRKWNLMWVGKHKVAPLEPDEIEKLLGFPRDHTRGGGISRTERYRSLGNSFQVDTVAFHLSVLKEMFPNGITVLSLFSGIGGAEVALHRLGINIKAIVSVEISQLNRNIVRSWWEQTNQKGVLIDLADVQELSPARLEQLICSLGGFDLVIGGSPCNNLAGSNRVSRDGLEGAHSSLFYDYFRILDLVKCIMGKNT